MLCMLCGHFSLTNTQQSIGRTTSPWRTGLAAGRNNIALLSERWLVANNRFVVHGSHRTRISEPSTTARKPAHTDLEPGKHRRTESYKEGMLCASYIVDVRQAFACARSQGAPRDHSVIPPHAFTTTHHSLILKNAPLCGVVLGQQRGHADE